MKRILLVGLTLIVAAAAVGQAPQLAVYPDVTTSQTQAGIDLLSYKSVVEGNIATVFQLEQNNAAAIASIPAGAQGPVGNDGAPGPMGPAGPAGPKGDTGIGPAVELLLVIPFGSTGFSDWTLSATPAEYVAAPRTQRIVDFSTVHQFRLCASVLIAASGYIELDQSTGSWTPLSAKLPISVGLSCTVWQNYSGPVGDSLVRISGAGSGTPRFQFVSVQLR